jgi:hypothetical protein
VLAGQAFYHLSHTFSPLLENFETVIFVFFFFLFYDNCFFTMTTAFLLKDNENSK